MSESTFPIFHAGSLNFGAQSLGMRITFSGAVNATIATIKADGTPIGVVALNGREAEPETEAFCEIDPTCGVHDVTLEPEGPVQLSGAEPIAESPFARVEYTPVPPENLIPLHAESWEATDMLGRKIASVEDVRGNHPEKKVGIFYWTWHENQCNKRPVDVVDVLDRFPAAEYRRDHPAWGKGPFQCFWHEPLYGFYRDADPYIIRHHAALLAAAGVDFLAFDCTNGALLWRDAYEPLLQGLEEARQDGIRTPQIAFILNFAPFPSTNHMLRSLYQNLYRPGLYEDLWFRVDGKPLVMGLSEALPAEGICETDTRILNEIRQFFTFRPCQPSYGFGQTLPNQWGWLEKFPQHKFNPRLDGSCEQMTVGVAQNANKDRLCTHFNDRDTFGRSYTEKDGFAHLSKDSYKYGYNVQEQWERALDADPDIVFITGWNEWIMGQFHEPWLSDNDSTQLAMVDQYDREHSRDIEMDKDGHLDTYYLQMAHNIRRFKGAPARETVSGAGLVNLDSDAAAWEAVTPVYVNPKGMTIHRDWDGFPGCHYVNDSGRNDFTEARVSRDDRFVYFRMKCAEEITPREGEGWMTLYLDTDRSKETGWEGYDFVINRLADENGKALLEAYAPTAVKNSYTWTPVGSADYRVDGQTLTVAVPLSLFGDEKSCEKLDFEFKWSDHMMKADVMDFYQNGDVAPIGRFNYLYRV